KVIICVQLSVFPLASVTINVLVNDLCPKAQAVIGESVYTKEVFPQDLTIVGIPTTEGSILIPQAIVTAGGQVISNVQHSGASPVTVNGVQSLSSVKVTLYGVPETMGPDVQTLPA